MLKRMQILGVTVVVSLMALMLSSGGHLAADESDQPLRVSIEPQHVSKDRSVDYDYPIVYVRVARREDGREVRWSEFSKPTYMEPGADLMLLHPDGSEEVLVSGQEGSVMDPYVGFDGEWVFYAKFIDEKHSGADIYKIHVPTRKIVRLTDQQFTPNTGAADWENVKMPYGVFNLGPCPAPGGKVVFTSNRNAYVPPRGYPRTTLQLFVMDDDGKNVEQIGFLNIAGALHPVILKDGRILFSSLESQGRRNAIMWGIWAIRPDGTKWEPVVSAFPEGGAPSGFHFQTQLSDETIIIERYYNQNQKGFGTLFTLPPALPEGTPPFGPGDRSDPRNTVEFFGEEARDGFTGGHRYLAQNIPYTPTGMKSLTPWIHWADIPAPPTVLDDPKSPRIGKVTHPCGAPDNHLLVAWTLGPIGGSAGRVRDFMGPQPIDSGLYLIKDGSTTTQPGEMLLIKNDPHYNEQWPRPLVSYRRIYGVDEPAEHVHQNDGKQSDHLPAGTPFGLVGTSSLYKRESAPGGQVPEGSVTAVATDWSKNWGTQGSDAGTYDNSQIHAIRIVIQEPLSAVTGGRQPLFGSHANERLRVLGEIPVRKFVDGEQPVDPDGNPDTSFLAKIPADQSFTFQTIDKHGMVLNSAQTWHQLRPGEIRHDCGGCHAHSQLPTRFEETYAARPDYELFDLTKQTPLVTAVEKDESGKKWEEAGEAGLKYVDGPRNVEYYRDIQPILKRSCAACHTKDADQPAGGLVLDDDETGPEHTAFGADAVPSVMVPATYYRLAGYARGYEIEDPQEQHWRRHLSSEYATRYVRKFQSRRSPLVWKLYGRRMDGTTNDDQPSLDPKDPQQAIWKGESGPVEKHRHRCDVDHRGSIMPPPKAVETGKVEPLSDEDRRTIVRWIDLGCPIDLDPQYDPHAAQVRSYGWMGDDQRPTLTVSQPAAGRISSLERILIGMHDAYSGLDLDGFTVVADFNVNGAAAGENLAARFEQTEPGIWQIELHAPITERMRGTLEVSVKDRQGNVSRVERTFSIAP